MRAFLYALLMTLLTPLLLVGFPFYFLPLLRSRGRISGTAYEPFNARLLYDLMGTRPDGAARRLAGGLPATNRGFLYLVMRPMAWASRVTGYSPNYLRYPPPHPAPMSAMVGLRCEFLDQAMRDHVVEGGQVVVLGAGWDTRAYGPLAGRGVKVFEVDTPGTQAVKTRALERTDIEASHVTFVSCDFNRRRWLDALRERGFDPALPTFVLWEGVTMYLEEEAVRDTLDAVSTLPAGSAVAFDFFSREWLEDTFAGRMARWSVRATYGEAFRFGFPVAPDLARRMGERLEEHGLALERSASFGGRAEEPAPCGGLVLGMRAGG